MALGGVIWGSAAATAGASYTLLGAAVLFLTSQLLVALVSEIRQNLSELISTMQRNRTFARFQFYSDVE
jgi:hypothetical protein